MAEEIKVYGFCENKCRREVLSKEAADKRFDEILEIIKGMGGTVGNMKIYSADASITAYNNSYIQIANSSLSEDIWKSLTVDNFKFVIEQITSNYCNNPKIDFEYDQNTGRLTIIPTADGFDSDYSISGKVYIIPGGVNIEVENIMMMMD